MGLKPLAIRIGIVFLFFGLCCCGSSGPAAIPDPVGQYQGTAGATFDVIMVLDAGGHGSAAFTRQGQVIEAAARFHGALGFGFIRFRAPGYDDWAALISYDYGVITGPLFGSGFDGASFDVAKISGAKQRRDPPGLDP